MKRLFSPILTVLMFCFAGAGITMAQESVPAGIHYQAVARDNDGDEITNTRIAVRFSIRTASPVGTIVYQEIFTDVITSKFGVFSLIIGKGDYSGGTATSFGDIDWSTANHYLQVEVKFENDYLDMGTMQFMAVPYALYAQQSLEPGPQGEKGDKGDKGDQGDPATDDQTLSVINVDGSDYLAISGGNSVKISTIENDGDPENELQDLRLSSNILTITDFSNATQIDLSPYLQTLNYNASTYALGISGQTATVDLSGLKNDNDSDATNEIQTLSYNESTKALAISGTGGNSVTLGTEVAFRVRNTVSDVVSINTYPVMTYDVTDYNTGSYMNTATGIFTVPADGIYTFNISYTATGTGDARKISLYVNGVLYEDIASSMAAGTVVLVKSVTMKLSATNTVSIVLFTGFSTDSGTCNFSGYKVN